MRMSGVVAILLAVAALLVSVMKAEGHRHDESSCACYSLDTEVVGPSDLSFEAAQESAVELATVNGNDHKTNRDAEILGREILASTAPRHEAGLRHVAFTFEENTSAMSGTTDGAHDKTAPTKRSASSDTNLAREIRSRRCSGTGVNFGS